MGKTAKSSKKFVKKHLKSTIAHRRKLKPMKKAFKRKLASSSSSSGRKQVAGTNDVSGEQLLTKKLKDMNADEFLDGKFLNDGSDDDGSISHDDSDNDIDESLFPKDAEDEFIDITPADLQEDDSEEDEGEDSTLRSQNKSLLSEVEKHKKQLEKLKLKDPEFFQFLEEHDKELLDFDDDEEGAEVYETEQLLLEGKDKEAPGSRLTTSLVEAWCRVIKEKHHIGTVCNLLRAYRTACHYGDGEDDEFANKYNISSSHVFNKIMFFTLSEIDGVFKKILGVDVKEGFVFDSEKHARWKKVEPLVKSYFGNTLHILTQMTDNHMISFTMKRLKASTCFLAALPRFARKYLKVALNFWGRGEGTVSLVSFLFVREMALLMGTDQLDACLKGIYKEYAANTKFVSASALPRIRFMVNCVVELYGIDLAASYQQAFVFIRQLAIILRNALTMKTKESFKHVYSWQYINCLELWVQVLCTYSGKKDLQPLVYPLTQIISGVAHLVPTARYFPLRMHCAELLNRLASSTGTFIPVSALLLDMLEFKELNKSPSGGVGKSIDFGCVLKVSKPTVKTRAFQDECVAAAIEQFSDHLGQWSYSIAFPELALVPLTGLRRFAKTTKVDRFRRQVKQLVDHIQENIEYVGRKRDGVNFSPKDSQLVASFLQEEKLANLSPLSKFATSLRQSAEQRRSNLHTSSVVVKEESKQNSSKKNSTSQGEDMEEEGAIAFSSDWLPPKKALRSTDEGKAKAASSGRVDEGGEDDSDAEDIVEDLELSSDDDVDENMEALTSSDEEQLTEGNPKRNKRVVDKKPKKLNARISSNKPLKRKKGKTGKDTQRGGKRHSKK